LKTGFTVSRLMAALQSSVCLLLAVAFAVLFPGIVEARQKEKAPTALKEVSEPVLRVKLGSMHKKLTIKFPEGGQIINKRGRRIKSLRKNESFSWALPESGKRRQKIEYAGEKLQITGNRPLLELNGKRYRGSFLVSISEKGALVVNHVGIEDYLRGVVGSEIGSRAPAESIKAQTVIARTYAYASRGKHGADGADVCDSTHCQVYSGAGAERDTINPAVDGTRGIIMISDGEPITTLYHATCGGMTSDNDKVYGGAPRSYLRRVVCPFCRDGINYRWSRSIGVNELRTALRKEKIVFEQLKAAEIEAPGHMDRVSSLNLTTNRGVFKIKGTTIRRLFNLPSTTFVLAERRLPSGIIAAAGSKPVSAKALRVSARAKIFSLNEDAPPQMFLLSAGGLKRTRKPDGGWQTIFAETSVQQEAEKSVITINPRAVTSLNKLELFGRGYGHQVGLCQSGAIELGKRSWSYRQILALYYSNVALRSLDY
jgi:stage II sporulation protein D